MNPTRRLAADDLDSLGYLARAWMWRFANLRALKPGLCAAYLALPVRASFAESKLL